jgi:hypothetical protein
MWPPSSASSFALAIFLAGLLEQNHTLAPFSALRARSGATIPTSAALKACTVLFAGVPHSQDNHLMFIKVKPDNHHCINSTSSKCAKNNHTSMDCKCLFWQHHFGCDWLKHQFKHN